MSANKHFIAHQFREIVSAKHPLSSYESYSECDDGFKVYYKVPEGRTNYLKVSSCGEVVYDPNPPFIGGILSRVLLYALYIFLNGS